MTGTPSLDVPPGMPVPSRTWGFERLVSHSYDGGLHGTCWECPFAEGPLDRDGESVPFERVSNDPTEAHYRCALPTRAEDQRLAWGEYAPCTEDEWRAWLETMEHPAEGILRKLLGVGGPGMVLEIETRRLVVPCGTVHPSHDVHHPDGHPIDLTPAEAACLEGLR